MHRYLKCMTKRTLITVSQAPVKVNPRGKSVGLTSLTPGLIEGSGCDAFETFSRGDSGVSPTSNLLSSSGMRSEQEQQTEYIDINSSIHCDPETTDSIHLHCFVCPAFIVLKPYVDNIHPADPTKLFLNECTANT